MIKKTIRIAGIIEESITEGPGLRFVVFAQGCLHACKGCHNPKTHDFDGGYEATIEKIINKIKKNPLLQGVTFSGGEPFSQADEFYELAKLCHKNSLDVFVYTGYKIEELIKISKKNKDFKNLLKESDIIIDGKFILEEKSLLLKFRGSKNQRIIDPKLSLLENKAIIKEVFNNG